MASSPTFTGPGGGDAAEHILKIARDVLPTEGDCLEAGLVLRSRIRERTFAGRDADGNEFTAYSERYAKYKASHGRSTMPNLYGVPQNAHMLDDIFVVCGANELTGQQEPGSGAFSNDTPGNEIRLELRGDQATRARVHNEGGTVSTRLGKGKGKPKKGGVSSFSMPRRHFFDANREDIDLMGFTIRERIDSRLRSK
jgi:hypothetical protein